MSTSEEIKEAITHWRELAEEQLARPTWDKSAVSAICGSSAEMYKLVAEALELELKTGISHCSCHLRPYTEAHALDADKARRR